MGTGSGVEDQKIFLQKILSELGTMGDLVQLLDALESKCSGIEIPLLEKIENETAEIETVSNNNSLMSQT